MKRLAIKRLKREFENEKRELINKYEMKITEKNNEIDRLKIEIEK